MYRTSFKTIVGWLAGGVGILALVLASVGTAAADDDDEYPPPYNVRNTSTLPGCLAIYFNHSAPGVHNFGVAVDNGEMVDVGTSDHREPVCGLQDNSKHSVKVCAQYETPEAPVACTEPPVDLWTVAGGPGVGEMAPQPKPGAPVVKPITGETATSFGVGWDSGTHYEKYFVWAWPENGGLITEEHKSSGNWGWYEFKNLKPDTLYSAQVQGCTGSDIPFVEDKCWDKSNVVQVRTKPYPLHSGADTCLPGFVWREAFQGDTVCVAPPRRDAVKADNAAASSRLNEGGNCTPGVNCTFTTSDICKQGFVWREIRPEDHVCVSPQERDLVQQENAMANQRRAAPR